MVGGIDMTIKEFSQIDNTFNEASFLTKVNNIFIKFFTAIMKDRLDEVDHFIGDDVFTYGEEILAPIRASNYRKMYDELNVKDSFIDSIEIINNSYIITVNLEARYMDYILDLSSGHIVSGNDSSRIKVDYKLTFEKKVDATDQGISKKCHACGAPMNVNNSGLCNYCGTIYKQEKHDWVMINITKC